MLEKKIEGLQPYNEIFYRNCFYNSFFPIVKFYGGKIEEFLINDIPNYKWNSNDKSLSIDFLAVEKMEEILRRQKINENKMYASKNIIMDIKKSIDEDKPVIIYIDCFYEPLRKDTYLKVHLPHTLLIYGYDDMEEELKIIEHRNKDGLTYDFKTLGYEELEKAYDSMLQRYYINELKHVYYDYKPDISRQVKNENRSYWEIYRHNIRNNMDTLIQGVESIKLFQTALNDMVFNVDVLNQGAEQLTNTLNDIINAKIAEKYKLKLIKGGTSEVLQQLDDIIQNWSIIRIEIVRFMYSGVYEQSNFLPIKQLLNHVYLVENNYLEGF